jgi:hypothetical protein
MAGDSKDTIYVDVDEEITGIISKIQNSSKDIVALVLPKRAAVLQSSVNMKLLKRAQDQHKKKIVLITSESRILPLAGAAGLFVASNLTSTPYVPLAKVVKDAKPDADEIDPNTPVSQVAPDAKYADTDDEIEIDNTPKGPEAVAAAAAGGNKAKKDKKNKVPNFSKFRKKVILIALVVLLLIFGLVYGLLFAPKAHVTVKAQTDSLPTTLDFIADPNASGADTTSKIVRASVQTTQKDQSEQVNSSGKENKGNKATGNVTLTNCSQNNSPTTVPANTQLSSNGIIYITKKSVSLPFSGHRPDGSCDSASGFTSGSVSITAQNPGANANVSNNSFSVSGYSDVNASGSASGGTDNNVKVVTQADVDKAKERIAGEPNTARDDFKAQLQKDGYIAIDDSFKAKPGKYGITPKVGDEGDQVTVSVTTTYTMLGVKKEDLQELIKNQVSSQDQGKTILSDGLDNATIKINDSAIGLSDGQVGLNINTTVIAGPNINQDDLKQKIAGKKSGEAENILGQVSGLSDPKVELSPFWVGHVPKKNSKITIEIQQSDGSSIP